MVLERWEANKVSLRIDPAESVGSFQNTARGERGQAEGGRSRGGGRERSQEKKAPCGGGDRAGSFQLTHSP